MHNLALTVILADQRRRQCPCGAVADRPLDSAASARTATPGGVRPPLAARQPAAGSPATPVT
jgi:hypothetical protein